MKGEETTETVLAQLMRYIKRKKAERELQRLTDERRNSYEIRRYREKRHAALKGLGRA